MPAALASGAIDRRWWLALVASMLAHFLLLAAPGWRLPLLDDLLSPAAEARLDARLGAPKAPAVAPKPPPVRRPAPAPETRPLAAPSPAVALDSQSAERPLPQAGNAAAPAANVSAGRPETSSSSASSIPPIATLPAATLPTRARILFAVTSGENGFVVGRTEHIFSRSGNVYALRAVAETTGMVALFRSARVVQTSRGELGDNGLRPDEFRTERGSAGGSLGDSAVFDWTAGRVAMSPGPADSPSEPGMQDLLSMFYQLALMPASPEGTALTVATGKKIERFVFARVGEALVTTPLGARRVLQLKTIATTGGDATEVWIDLERRLPLRIRYVDRKGEVFEQRVEEMEIE